MLLNLSQSRSELARRDYLKAKATVVGCVPWNVSESSERQHRVALLVRPRCRRLDEPAAPALTRMGGVYRDLLDMRRSVDDIQEEVSNGSVEVISVDERSTRTLVPKQLANWHSCAVCDGSHPFSTKHSVSSSLNAGQRFDVVRLHKSDHPPIEPHSTPMTSAR